MISEKDLQKRAARYADAVLFAVSTASPWGDAKKLIEAAYFNGFQSGVCWQKGTEKKAHLGICGSCLKLRKLIDTEYPPAKCRACNRVEQKR